MQLGELLFVLVDAVEHVTVAFAGADAKVGSGRGDGLTLRLDACVHPPLVDVVLQGFDVAGELTGLVDQSDPSAIDLLVL